MHSLVFAESIQLFPDGTIFIHIALILLMIWVLNRTFFRPINQVIDSREKFKNVAGGEAGAISNEAAEKEERYAAELRDARTEGYALIEEQHKKLVRAREKKISETKADLDQKIAAERGEIDKQATAARSAIGSEAEKLADKIAANILK
jgi:F0F1-type ATP synthase membrane subunit b/b'